MRKSDFCLYENKGADQICSNWEADQCLCFSYKDSAISLLLKSEISSFFSASVTVQVGLCQTWSLKPRRPVFWRCGSFHFCFIEIFISMFQKSKISNQLFYYCGSKLAAHFVSDRFCL